MQYRVLWSPDAEAELERLIQDSEPSAFIIADTVREIDSRLFDAPHAFGESRFESIRIGFVYPLGVQFEVMHDVRTVIVHDVWRF
jgi:hypothetical protein